MALDYFKMLKDNDDQNRVSLNGVRKGEFVLNVWGALLTSAIVAFGLSLVGQGNEFGKDIVGGTVLFISGFLAGKGAANQ